MGKAINHDVLDGALTVLRGATRLIASATQPIPTDYAGAIAARLTEVGMTAGDYSTADESIANGGGRKITVAAKTGVHVIVAGTAAFVSLLDATRILYTTTCPPRALTYGSRVNFGDWDIAIADPV